MKKKYLLIVSLILLTGGSLMSQNIFSPPETPQKPVIDQLHGMSLTDPYQWLENKEDEAVYNWTKAQHDATDNYFQAAYTDIEGLNSELTTYVDRDFRGAVRLVNDRQFFTLKKKGDKQSTFYTILDGEDVMLFDPMMIDTTGKTSISGFIYSFDAKKVAVLVQYAGNEINTAYIIDSKTGKQLVDPIEGLRGFSWTRDGEHAYIRIGTQEMLEKQIPLKTFRLKIGDKIENAEFLLQPDDAKDFAVIGDSKYSNVSFINKGDFYSNTLLMINEGSEEKLEIFSSDEFKAEPFALGGKIYIKTNYEAPNFKIMVADIENPAFEDWKELYSEKETVLVDYTITDKYMFIIDQKDIFRRIFKYSLSGELLEEIKLPEVGNAGSLNFHRESKRLFVTINTFFAPIRIYELDQETYQWKLYYEQESPLKTENMEAKIEFVEARDGAKIPVFIIHKKDMVPDGNNPTLLYGYGGFNIGISVSYIGSMATFVNRGGVYIIAGIRGGDEYGETWHLDGMMYNKQNTFNDFIDVAEYLFDEKYTNPEKLCVRGGSNGGLLIGAMITQRPDLFKAAVCQVPLLDMIRYHKFLIARYWIPEYGDPDIADDFNYLLTYSPYHNIRVGVNHPTSLVIAGENDTRVDPLHAKKFVAALQNNIGQENPVMLHMDFGSGHGSGKSTEQIVYDLEFVLKFIMNELGM